LILTFLITLNYFVGCCENYLTLQYSEKSGVF